MVEQLQLSYIEQIIAARLKGGKKPRDRMAELEKLLETAKLTAAQMKAVQEELADLRKRLKA